jgi:large subunit ribosomal protein L1
LGLILVKLINSFEVLFPFQTELVKQRRIGAFTDLGNEAELKALGVTVAGGDDLIDTILHGELSILTLQLQQPGMMKKMGKAAKVLGPKGLMPNPKAGTVGEDLTLFIKELLAGRFEFKNDKQGNVHSIVGKLSFGNAKLRENIEFFVKSYEVFSSSRCIK